MKRYFLVPAANLTDAGAPNIWHGIDLSSHGGSANWAVVVEDNQAVPATWVELPVLIDPSDNLGMAARQQQLIALGFVGATAVMTGYQLANKLAAIHPSFKP